MNKEIARVTSWNDCIVIGCRLEDGHEGPHDFSVPVSNPWILFPIVDLSALPAGPAVEAEEAVLAQPFAISVRPPAGPEPVSAPGRPLPGDPDYQAWARNERGVRDPQAAHERYLEELAQRDRELGDVASGWVPAGRTPRVRMAALALAVLLPLLAAGPAHAAKRPACQPIPNGKGGTVWARPDTKGGWSTLSCEAVITLHHTDRVKAPTVKSASPTACTAWLPEDVGPHGERVVEAHQMCIDAMHAAAEREVGK